MSDGPPRSSLAARIGLAIVRPRWALAIASDRRFAGRSGTDLIVLIVGVVLATHLSELAGAVWLGVEVNSGLGLGAATRILTGALSVKLGLLILAALVLWLGAGARRNLGRAFDLACVAAIPLFVVELVALVAARALDTRIPLQLNWLAAAASWAWMGALVALAWRPARARATAPPPPVEIVRPARRAGWAVVAGVAAGAALHVAWIAQNAELIRPMQVGEPAAAVALPAIDAHGELGPHWELAKGRVTVLDFWATWCGPCLRAMPKLEALAGAHAGVDVVAINMDDAEAARALFDQRGWKKLILLMDDGDTSRRYNVSNIPHTVVIDRAGIVVHDGRDRSTTIEAAVRAALAR